MNKNNFVVLIYLISAVCQAEMNLIHMKGVHEAISPNYQVEMSPVNGYTLLKTNLLSNRRLWGNFGPKNPKFGCLDNTQIGGRLIEKNDCPQDENSELIQQLFPALDGTLTSNRTKPECGHPEHP